MAGHQDEDGIGLQGLTHGSGRARRSRQQSHLAVADGMSWVGAPQHRSYTPLEGRQAAEIEGNALEVLGLSR